jgi:hypothetical protein
MAEREQFRSLSAAKVRFYFELLHFTSLKVQKGGRM